jgi:hypothetical protein
VNKTVSSVIDDINEWENPRGGSVFYVTAIFTDETVGSAGRKDHDAALEVQGLLREAIGVEQDFTLEPKGQTKTGRDKFKILGFGTPGGAVTYTAPGVQGGSGSGQSGSPHRGDYRPEHDVDASIRAAVALKAAASFLSMSAVGMEKVLEVAEFFEEWLERKTSGPASSAYGSTVSGTVQSDQAGVGSEDLSGGVSSLSTPDSAGLVDSGEGEAPESTPHEHDWQLRQGVKGFLVCECGKTRKKETA